MADLGVARIVDRLDTAPRFTAADAIRLNQTYRASETRAMLEAVLEERVAGRVAVVSSFGAESALLLHMATRLKPDIKVVMVDTGYLFPETYEFMEKLRHRFNLNVWMYRTRQDPIADLHRAGELNPFERNNVEGCCAVNKNEPFERAFKELQPKAWLRGTRRDQVPVGVAPG